MFTIVTLAVSMEFNNRISVDPVNEDSLLSPGASHRRVEEADVWSTRADAHTQVS
jgi:hypothetical protein